MRERDISISQEKCEEIRLLVAEVERELARNPPDKAAVRKAAAALTMAAERLGSLAR